MSQRMTAVFQIAITTAWLPSFHVVVLHAASRPPAVQNKTNFVALI